MLGPYGEMGVTVAASHKAGDGRTLLRRVLPVHVPDAGRRHRRGRVLGFPKKEAFIRVLEHGGAPDDGLWPRHKAYAFDYFSFLMIRNGYVLHSATGKYDDADLPAKPKFYGNTEYGRMNMKVFITRRPVRVALGARLPPLVGHQGARDLMGRPDSRAPTVSR